MPYVTMADRALLDAGKKTPDTAGELNYMITKLLCAYVEKEGISYARINDCLGAREGAKLEFYRRLALVGPMRGIPEFNFPAFHKFAAELRAQGHEVFSPAERDIERHNGADLSKGNATGDEAQAVKQHGFSLRDALADDTAYICKHAEAIALMPGWSKSKGAVAELALSLALGHEIMYLHGAEVIHV